MNDADYMRVIRMMSKSNRVGWGRIVLHVILPAGLTVLLFVGIIFGIMLPKFRECVMQEKLELTRELGRNICNLLQHYYQRHCSGELTESEAQKRVLDRIRVMRYGSENKNYFWVHTLEPVMVMHPYRLDLEGQNITNLQDSRGKHFILEMNQLVQTSPMQDGYVDYYWQWNDAPHEEMPKLSYVRLYEPWGWVVGTGIYLDDVRAEVQALTAGFRRNLLIVCAIITGFCGYLILHGIRGERQRQESRRQLQESFERFKTVMDSLQAFVSVSDAKTHEVLFLNESARRAFGNGIGKPCREAFGCRPDKLCGFCPEAPATEALPSPQAVTQWEFQDERTRQWFDCRIQQIRWVDGREALLEISTDITPRKNAEQEREQLLKSLAGKNEELQSIVYIASHDLRSPLINIQGFTAELESGLERLGQILTAGNAVSRRADIQTLLDDEIPESLSFIKTGTQKMQMLVNGLLQLSRLGIAELNMQTLDMEALLRAVVSECQYQISSLDAQVIFDRLPACRGDYKLVNQVFTNLIDNALKYAHPHRSPRIEITGRRNDGRIEYAVADNGVGIEPQHLTKIFDMFCQCNSRKMPVDGVGLGLTIVKRILDLLDGQIRVESEYDKGSVFYVVLPAAE